jgi:peptidoglycan/LPS O-acetylase OafA/YrhL
VTWSLSCEIFFYALFPLLHRTSLRLPLRTQWLLALGYFGCASMVVVIGSFVNPDSAFALFRGEPGGMHGRVRAGRRRRPHDPLRPADRGPGAAAGARLLRPRTFVSGSPACAVWTTPIYLLIIVAVAQAAVAGRQVLGHPWLVYSGKVSFCFYLVHQLVLETIFAVHGAGRGQAVAGFVLSCMFAVLLHHAIENPAHRLMTARFAAQKHTTASDPVSE